MSDAEFKPGDSVTIQALHLFGIKAKVLFEKDGLYFCRVQEHAFEGHIVSFPGDQLSEVV